MIHPATELRFISPDIGYGVFAREPIASGTIVWALCSLDMIFTAAEVAAFSPAYQPIFDHYAYTDGAGRVILCWDHGRFVNHSCDPAILSVGGDFEMAVRDIAAGEEITCEYGNLNLTEPMECQCGAVGCRGVIHGDDVLRLWPELDRRVAELLPQARAVPQPLLEFARDSASFWNWIEGRAPLPSYREYYAGQADALPVGDFAPKLRVLADRR